MASSFPSSIDSFTNPLSNSALNSPSHAGQHQDLNDAVNKIETYMGLVKVIPTSVTGGTLAANGTITIGSAQSTITIDGCFTSLYDNYRIIVTNTTPSTNGLWQFKYRSGASTITAGNYQHAALRFDTTSTSFNFGASGVGYHETSINFVASSPANAMTIDFYSPFLTQETNGLVMGAGQITGVSLGYCAMRYAATTSMTGIILNPSSGTVTGGTIRIYGYRN